MNLLGEPRASDSIPTYCSRYVFIGAYNGYTEQSAEEGMRLATLAKNAPPNGVIVEIGSLNGGSAEAMIRSTDCKRAITIIDICIRQDLRDRLNGWPVRLIESDSCALEWNEPIALLHLDSSHEYAATKRELDIYASQIVPGGFLVIHDFHNIEPFSTDQQRAWREWPLRTQFQSLGAVPRTQHAWRRLE